MNCGSGEKIVVGVDPDCNKSGFAIYKDGKLVELLNLNFKEYCTALQERRFGNCMLVIEDANHIKTMYARNRHIKPQAQAQIAQSVGRVKMLATCMIDYASLLGYSVLSEKPTKSNFANDKPKFEFYTKWEGRSNPETRSAAFFGLKYCR